MNDTDYGVSNRMDILKRFIRTIVCMMAFELVKVLAYATIFLQYAFLFVTGRPAGPLRSFGNKLSTYAYSILRYATLNGNNRPFPFSNLPADHECEKATSKIDYS